MKNPIGSKYDVRNTAKGSLSPLTSRILAKVKEVKKFQIK